MPNTTTSATGSPPIQRSRALSNGREPPTSARNMSASSSASSSSSSGGGIDSMHTHTQEQQQHHAIDSHPFMLKVNNKPAVSSPLAPPTPPRINVSSCASSPACTSPLPPSSLSSSTPIPKPSLLQSLKGHFKSTPPATPPRSLACSSPAGGTTPTILSPRAGAGGREGEGILSSRAGTGGLLSPPPRAGGVSPSLSSPAPPPRKVLAASTPNDAGPRVVNTPSSAARAHAPNVTDSPLLSRRAPALLPHHAPGGIFSARTCAEVVCTPPRTALHQSTLNVPPPSSAPIVSLKSSHGISMVKSPRAKDYLLAHLASTPAIPLTRSKSPPPRTSVASPAFASPNAVRKLSEPVPVRDALKGTCEGMGTCEGIGMPYNVTHTTHVARENMTFAAADDVIVMNNNNAPMYEKSGYLHKWAGSAYKERWFECKRSTLSYYNKKDSNKPRREIHLSDCEFEREKNGKRLYTVHLVHTPTKKNYYFAAPDADSFNEWVRVFHSSGAIDKDLVLMEKDHKEKERKEAEAMQEKELKKQEDEYVREKLKKRSTLKIINKNMTDCTMESCVCTLTVLEVVEKESRSEFKISITFDDQNWTIFRNFDKVLKMYQAMSKLKFVKGMCPPRKCPAEMRESEFSNLQILKLQVLLDTLARNRPCVLAASTPKQRFLRFIAPVGWDDVKPKDFVMPFQFDF